MATTATQCSEWEWGSDCSFDTRHFYLFWCLAWAFTTVMLLVTMIVRNTVGNARACLSLSALASLISSVDSAIPLLSGQPPKQNQLLFAGSFLIALALIASIEHWCDVAAFLSRVNESDDATNSTAKLVSVIRYGYRSLALIHVPLAALRASAGMEISPYPDGVMTFSVWMFAFTCCVAFCFAVLMWVVAKRRLKDVPNSQGLRTVSVINLWEQVRVTAFCAYSIVLYWTSNGIQNSVAEAETGMTEAIYANFCYLIYWGMSMTVAAFVLRVKSQDPIRSGQELQHLIMMHEAQIAGAKQDAQAVAPTPSTIGSPQLEGSENSRENSHSVEGVSSAQQDSYESKNITEPAVYSIDEYDIRHES